MNPALVLDVVRFELARSFTVGRVALWVLLVAFPIVLVGLLRTQIEVDRIEPWGLAVYLLIPEITCLLGLLLWATPVVSTELEGQTWTYLALRPAGRVTVALGKYVTAIAWTVSAAWIATTGCVLLIGSDQAFRLWSVMSVLATLSCVTHAALFLLIGVLFFRRTMVAAVVYVLVVEFGMSFVPALINKLTINYRLRGLLAGWMQWEQARSQAENVFGSEPPAVHLVWLAGATCVFLVAAVLWVRRAEYPTQQEGG
jgi:ABC-type transport system involved in multi-copper enzyme maturation permease subunit